MIGVSVFGSGRMGWIYAPILQRSSRARLVSVVNPNLSSAEKLTAAHDGRALADPDAALGDPDVGAVIIGTPTTTHLELIEKAAKAGKAILCEKPLDLSLERCDRILEILAEHPVPIMLGFNRRFDPGVAKLREAVAGGAIGALNMLLLTSRDPAPPPIGYVRNSGGYFVDSTIHDIDLACWIAGERPAAVYAAGGCLVDPEIGAAGDVDTTMTVLRMPSGALVHVNNSRRAVYGFDQRIEAFGAEGMLQTENRREDNLLRWDGGRTEARAPLEHFFLERYADSFVHEVEAFLEAVETGAKPPADQHDGRRALAIALACERSRREGREVVPDYGD